MFVPFAFWYPEKNKYTYLNKKRQLSADDIFFSLEGLADISLPDPRPEALQVERKALCQPEGAMFRQIL